MSAGTVVAVAIMSVILMLSLVMTSFFVVEMLLIVVMLFVAVISVVAWTAVIALLGAVSVAVSFLIVSRGYVEDAEREGEDEDKHYFLHNSSGIVAF